MHVRTRELQVHLPADFSIPPFRSERHHSWSGRGSGSGCESPGQRWAGVSGRWGSEDCSESQYMCACGIGVISGGGGRVCRSVVGENRGFSFYVNHRF
jgi:hypothetical protein